MKTRDFLRLKQKVIINEILDNDAKMIISGMGSGKTAATLTALRHLHDTGESRRTLVIAPLRVATDVWPNEIGEWQHTWMMSHAVACGTEAERLAALAKQAEITIINRENLPWLAKTLGSVERWPFDTVIVDESSMFKEGAKRTAKTKRKTASGEIKVSPGGNITRFGVMTAARRKIRRIYELTGTPGEASRLWPQIYLLDQGAALGRTITAFRERWFNYNPYSHDYEPKEGAESEILSRAAHLMTSLPPDQLVEEPVSITVPVRFDDKMKVAYAAFKRTLVSKEYDVQALTSGVLANKLLQFCIAEGTPVVTARGMVPIENVLPDDLVWDGDEWVGCSGVASKGERQTMRCWGVKSTPDHLFLTSAGWRQAQEICGDGSGQVARFERHEVRLPDGYPSIGPHAGEVAEKSVAGQVCLRQGGGAPEPEPQKQTQGQDEVVRLQARREDIGRVGRAHDDQLPPVGDMDADEISLQKRNREGLQALRRAWYRHAGLLVQFFRRVLERCASRICRSSYDRPPGQQRQLLARKPPLGHHAGTEPQQAEHDFPHSPVWRDCPAGGCCRTERCQVHHGTQTVSEGAELCGDNRAGLTRVYDLVDCGPRSRFTVVGDEGPVVVHNCSGAMYRDDGSVAQVHDLKLKALESLVEESDGENLLVFYGFQFDLEQIRRKYPHAVVLNESKTAVADWNAGRIKMLLAHPASCAHGLNLQFGGHIAIWYGLTWSLELYQQANARLPRPGQTKLVAIYHIIVEDSYDEVALATLDRKDTSQKLVIDAVVNHLFVD